MTGNAAVRLGFIGLGEIASFHCQRLRNEGLAETIEAGMDVDPEARRSFADEYDATAYEDHEDVFATVDAVFVTTPNKYHERYVADALAAGLDVFVEKPLAHTVDSAERIAAVAADADGVCMVGFHNRFASPVRTLVGYRDAGSLGDVSHIEANYVRRRGVPGRGSWFTRDAVAGGGSLIDIGAHAIDLSLYLLGYPSVAEVAGDARAAFGVDEDYSYVDMWGDDEAAGEFSVDDSASAFIRCANGATVALEVAWATNRPDSQEYLVRGTDTGAKLDLGDQSLTLYETVDVGTMHHRTTDIETRREDPHVVEQRRFLDAVASETPPETNTVEQALTVQRVIDAIYRSSEAGEAVAVGTERVN